MVYHYKAQFIILVCCNQICLPTTTTRAWCKLLVVSAIADLTTINVNNDISERQARNLSQSILNAAGIFSEAGTVSFCGYVRSPRVFGGFVRVLVIVLDLCAVLLCIFTFGLTCYDIRYDFCIKTILDSSLPPVVCKGISCPIYVVCFRIVASKA